MEVALEVAWAARVAWAAGVSGVASATDSQRTLCSFLSALPRARAATCSSDSQLLPPRQFADCKEPAPSQPFSMASGRD